MSLSLKTRSSRVRALQYQHNDTNGQLVLAGTRIADDGIEVAMNPHPKAPFLLVVDQSGSMSRWLGELQSGMNDLLRAVMVEDELASLRADLAIVSCGGEVRTLLEFGHAKRGEMPFLAPLVAEGETPLGGAVRRGAELIRARQVEYRRQSLASYRPHVFILSDGRPTDPEWQTAAAELRQLAAHKGWIVHAFAIGEAADPAALQQFAVHAVCRIDPKQIRALLRWVSISMKVVSRSQQTGQGLPPVLPPFPQP